MGFDLVSSLNKAAEAADSFVKKAWQEKSRRDAAKDREAAAAAERARRAERNAFFATMTAKLSGATTSEMPPLVVDLNTAHRAVLFVTTPIAFGPLEVSRSSYNLLARHVGMSMSSVSHWALCVIDRGYGQCWAYDLMSDQLALNMLGKNYFRVYEVTPEFIATWSSCYYVGETTKRHEEIQEVGFRHMSSNPRYHLLENNCQHLVEALVAELCNGAHVEQAKLSEELKEVSPKIAMDLMAARLRSRIDDKKEHEDSENVKEDVAVLKSLIKFYDHHNRKKGSLAAIENGSTSSIAGDEHPRPLAIMPAGEPEPVIPQTASPGLLMPPGEMSPPLPMRPSSRGLSPRPRSIAREHSPSLPPRPSSSLAHAPVTPPYFPPPPTGAG